MFDKEEFTDLASAIYPHLREIQQIVEHSNKSDFMDFQISMRATAKGYITMTVIDRPCDYKLEQSKTSQAVVCRKTGSTPADKIIVVGDRLPYTDRKGATKCLQNRKRK